MRQQRLKLSMGGGTAAEDQFCLFFHESSELRDCMSPATLIFCLLTLNLLVSSADNLCKLFDTQTVFLKEFFEKVDFEKNRQVKGKRVTSLQTGFCVIC